MIPIFHIINLVAVVGTTLLMLAVFTIWYSSMAFGRVWSKDSLVEGKPLSTPVWRIVCTAFCFFVVLLVLSCAIALAPLLQLGLHSIALSAVAFAVAVCAVSALWEKRSLAYFLVNAGFVSVFIIGSTCVLYYWPW